MDLPNWSRRESRPGAFAAEPAAFLVPPTRRRVGYPVRIVGVSLACPVRRGHRRRERWFRERSVGRTVERCIAACPNAAARLLAGALASSRPSARFENPYRLRSFRSHPLLRLIGPLLPIRHDRSTRFAPPGQQPQPSGIVLLRSNGWRQRRSSGMRCPAAPDATGKGGP